MDIKRIRALLIQVNGILKVLSHENSLLKTVVQFLSMISLQP